MPCPIPHSEKYPARQGRVLETLRNVAWVLNNYSDHTLTEEEEEAIAFHLGTMYLDAHCDGALQMIDKVTT